MAGTFSQIYIQVIFAVKNRQPLLQESWRDELFSYMSGIITHKGQKSIAVNGYSDHVHCLIGLKPSMKIADLVRDIKNNSSKWINDQNKVMGRFSWQEGYSSFSYSRSQLDNVYHYILNQKEHHRTKSFKEEYLAFLKEFEVDYDERYVFD